MTTSTTAPTADAQADAGSQPATRDFVDVRLGAVRLEIAELRTEMRTEFAKVRQEMAELRTDLTTEMRTEFGQVRQEIQGLRGDMHRAMHSQTNKMLTLMVAMITLVLISSGFVTRLSG